MPSGSDCSSRLRLILGLDLRGQSVPGKIMSKPLATKNIFTAATEGERAFVDCSDSHHMRRRR